MLCVLPKVNENTCPSTVRGRLPPYPFIWVMVTESSYLSLSGPTPSLAYELT